MLLNLADHARTPTGYGAFPAVSTIARETSLTRRAVQKILPRLKNKGFISASGLMPRGAVRYSVNVAALHRERHSQTNDADCEQDSQTTERQAVSHCEPGSPGCEPGSPGGANAIHIDCEPGSPDPDLIRQKEPQRNPESQAREERKHQSGQYSELFQLLKGHALEIRRSEPDINFIDHLSALKHRAERDQLPFISDQFLSDAVGHARLPRPHKPRQATA